MRITMNTGEVFSCPVDGWLDSGSGAFAPASRTVSCANSGGYVSTISTKTGTYHYAASNARIVVEICDSQGTCCQTSSDGRGLDNPGQDRENGQTDVYTNTSILGNCAQEGSLVGDPTTAKLTTSDPDGADGWYVEWMRIT